MMVDSRQPVCQIVRADHPPRRIAGYVKYCHSILVFTGFHCELVSGVTSLSTCTGRFVNQTLQFLSTKRCSVVNLIHIIRRLHMRALDSQCDKNLREHESTEQRWIL